MTPLVKGLALTKEPTCMVGQPADIAEPFSFRRQRYRANAAIMDYDTILAEN
jgi:hypothetical protein